jgi:hypothetical protein
VTITETRLKAGPNFWIKMSFSLGDIDTEDIQTTNYKNDNLKELQFAVSFHTTNYVEKMIHTSSQMPNPFPTSTNTVYTNDWFGPKFAAALKHAAELCGGRRSSF